MQENKQEKSQIKQKILLYLQSKNISEYRFYKDSGITRGILQQPNGISEENLSRFLDYAKDINSDWLLTGKGEMLKTKRTSQHTSTENMPVAMPKDTNNPAITETPEHKNLQSFFQSSHEKSPGAIPLVSEKAVGGFANEHFSIRENDVLEYYVIPKFRYLGVDFMIELTGDSMMPRLYPGDIIACSIIHNSNFIQWNKPHLLATREQGLIVKRLRKSSDSNCLLAVSDNHEYDPIDIPKDEILGIARVVGVIHLE